MTDKLYWVWLAQILKPGSRHFAYLMEHFSSAYEIYSADEGDLRSYDLPERVSDSLLNKDLTEANAILDYCARNGIGILDYGCKGYPSRLRTLKNPPVLLYFKGEFPNLDNNVSIAVVGTRKMSEYGARYAYKIAYELASANVTIVSGMALGGDGAAACGALSAKGKTIAVLGSGVDVVYPPEHIKLYNEIVKHGAVISEYAPTTRPNKPNFPVRNRIISGLSNGTLVVECDMKSGAMITAEDALAQGREIFAIPGKVGEHNANGTNKLIKDGATMVLSSTDIISAYEFYYGHSINYTNLSYAQSHSEPCEEAFEKYGVCFVLDEEVNAENSESGMESMLRARRQAPIREKNESDLRERLKPRLKKRKPQASDTDTADPKEKKVEDAAPRIKRSPENTEKKLAALSDRQREILAVFPDDRAISADELAARGYSGAETMGSLALLEMLGIISSLPGGLYIKI